MSDDTFNLPLESTPASPPERIVAEVVPLRPWGPWATLGWGLLAAAAFVMVQTGLVVAFLVVELATNPGRDVAAWATSLEHNGLFIAVATCLANPAALAVCA